MKHAIAILTLCSVMLPTATSNASAPTSTIYKDITITNVYVLNKPGSPGSVRITANVDICPGSSTTAVIYNDTTSSADFRSTSSWFMAAYLAARRMDIQVTSLDGDPNLCRIEGLWIY